MWPNLSLTERKPRATASADFGDEQVLAMEKKTTEKNFRKA
jgi:hypothetical protein